ncbi:MAG: hypothetical protein WC674_07230 [Candidatus Krumholzibacteriia bacterium]
MEKVAPDSLTASRVYFTAFDRVTYSQVAWTSEDVSQIKRNLERQLKLLTLTKGHIVIAASHLLESELAREVIGPYPELFAKRIVVPALRSEFPNCAAFLQAKLSSSSPGEARLYSGDEQNAMAQLMDENALVVEWNVGATSKWFKDRLLADIQREDSLLGLILKRKGLVVPREMYARLEEVPLLSRGFVYQLAKDVGELEFREVMCTYADFLYYLSGARAVQSEGILPQENIIDFRLGELAGRATPLSENEVFFKIFIDVVKAATSTYFPMDFLDALSISDAIKLHSVAIDEHFVQKYNLIQSKTKQALEISDPERLVLIMEELDEFENNLHREFTVAINREIPIRLRELRAQGAKDFLHAMASLLVVVYGTIFGVKDVIVSGLRLADQDAVASSIEERIQGGLAAFQRMTDRRALDQRAVLLSFTERLKERYMKRLTSH